MDERGIIKLFAKLFAKHKIHYLLTGGFAVSYWGRPRATHDIDFLIEISPRNLPRLKDVFPLLGKDYAVNIQSQFNIIYLPLGLKLDFWIAKKTEFELNKFNRKITAKLFGERIAIISPEDLILTKLSWCRKVYSERHMGDCIGIWQIQREKLDEKYLNKWANELFVGNFLKAVKEKNLTPYPDIEKK